jgi:hypothetical protein
MNKQKDIFQNIQTGEGEEAIFLPRTQLFTVWSLESQSNL